MSPDHKDDGTRSMDVNVHEDVKHATVASYNRIPLLTGAVAVSRHPQ